MNKEASSNLIILSKLRQLRSHILTQLFPSLEVVVTNVAIISLHVYVSQLEAHRYSLQRWSSTVRESLVRSFYKHKLKTPLRVTVRFCSFSLNHLSKYTLDNGIFSIPCKLFYAPHSHFLHYNCFVFIECERTISH